MTRSANRLFLLNMPLITLFSAPKPFTDAHIATIQRNAIRSWTLLPQVDVLLLGRESGLAQAAADLNVPVLDHVACNASGTPLVSSMVDLARSHSSSPLLGIINADILLMPDFVEAAQRALGLKEFFVLLGQRWDMDITQPLDFSGAWPERMQARVKQAGRLHKPAGSDFFVFPLACYLDIPGFAIGRAGWDNWMIYQARKQKWPVIDCTPSAMIVHQNHDYSHLPDSKTHHALPETDENIRLAGGQAAIRYTILDSTQILTPTGLVRPRMSRGRFLRKLELLLRAVFFFLPEAAIEEIARPKRWEKRIKKIFRSNR